MQHSHRYYQNVAKLYDSMSNRMKQLKKQSKKFLNQQRLKQNSNALGLLLNFGTLTFFEEPRGNYDFFG